MTGLERNRASYSEKVMGASPARDIASRRDRLSAVATLWMQRSGHGVAGDGRKTNRGKDHRVDDHSNRDGSVRGVQVGNEVRHRVEWRLRTKERHVQVIRIREVDG